MPIVKPTPGPWTVHQEGDEWPGIEATIPVNCSIVVFGFRDEDEVGIKGNSHAEAMANAHLIAAAPELLEAVRLLLRETELSGNAEAADYGWPEATRKARTAIAKAEGRS